MNIASSPDLTPIAKRGESSAASAPSTGDSAGIPFDDLLAAPREDTPDRKPAPHHPPATPRQQPQDGTDPALTALLPFLPPQILPPPVPPVTGVAPENAGGNSVTMLQCGTAMQPGVQPDAMSTKPSLVVAAGKTAPQPDAATAGGAGQPAGVVLAAPAIAAAGVTSAETAAAPANPAATTPSVQPAPATVSAKEAPAEISPAVVEIVSSSALPPTGAVPENRASQRRNPGATGAAEANGTVGAMQRRTMMEPFTERQPKTMTSVAAVFSKPGDARAIFFPDKGEDTANAGAAEVPAAAMLTLMADPQTGRGAGANVSAPADVAAAQITRQTLEVAERVHATGRDHAEVQLHLSGGQEVTISLRLERGEWKPVFRTESESLCRALEQNWQRAAAQPTTPGVKFGSPTFETLRSQGQSDFSQNPQEQSGGRGRPFERQEPEPEIPFAFSAAPRTAARASRFSEAAAVQLYA